MARVSHRGSAWYDPSSPTIEFDRGSSPIRNLSPSGRSASCIQVAPRLKSSASR